jgi:hypothetical protein
MAGDDRDRRTGRNGERPYPESRPMQPREEDMPITLNEAVRGYGTIAAGYHDFVEHKLPAMENAIEAIGTTSIQAIGVAAQARDVATEARDLARSTLEEITKLRGTIRDGLARYASRAPGPDVPGTVPLPRVPSAHELASEIVEELKTNPGFHLPPESVDPRRKTDSERVRDALEQHDDAKEAEAYRKLKESFGKYRWAVLAGVTLAILGAVGGVLLKLAAMASEIEHARVQGRAEGRASASQVAPATAQAPPGDIVSPASPIAPASAAPAPSTTSVPRRHP